MQTGIFETCHGARTALAPHRHAAPYLALVVEGGYEEFSVDGAWRNEPGDLVVHPAWHLHANRFAGRRCRVLNVLLPMTLAADLAAPSGVWRLGDPDRYLEAAAASPEVLVELLSRADRRAPMSVPSRLTALAERMRSDPQDRIADLAAWVGLSREHASRSFRLHFGLSPRDFRAEERFRRTLALISEPGLPLAAVACDGGFSDQAHLTRWLRAATGMTPGAMRRELRLAGGITFVQ